MKSSGHELYIEWTEKFVDLLKGKDGQVASVGIFAEGGKKLLMGRRRDNGRWTLPGGHLNAGEVAVDGAVREVLEEAGMTFKPSQLTLLESKDITTWTGKEIKIHAFRADLEPRHRLLNKFKPDASTDPDQEVEEWEWIDVENGLPKEVSTLLHSEKNLVLQNLGLSKSQIANRKSQIMIHDLVKSDGGHKYLRKYMRNGQWVYIYHEPNHDPRVIKEEAVEHIKRLAEMGHPQAKKIHESMSEVNHEKVDLLQQLANMGNPEALKALKRMNIPHIKPSLHEQIAPASLRDPLDQSDPTASGSLIGIAKGVIRAEIAHLTQHPTNPLFLKLGEYSITPESLTEGMQDNASVLSNLKKFHENLKKLDIAHEGLPSSRAGADVGGKYSGLIWRNTASKLAELTGHPASAELGKHMKELGKRHEAGFEVVGANKIEEKRAERRRKEAEAEAARQEQERRELGAVHGTMAHHMNSMLATPLPAREVVKLNRAIKSIFGQELKKEDWPYNFEDKGFKVKITGVTYEDSGIYLDLSVINAQGEPVTTRWERHWNKTSSKPQIYNAFLKVHDHARGGVQIGNLINAGQRKLLKKVGGGKVKVGANIDIGGYTWANQGFSFENSDTLRDYRRTFKQWATSFGVHLSDADMEHFKEPCHFAAFSNGKKYLINNSNSSAIPLSQNQIANRSLSGVPDDTLDGASLKLTAEEIRSGKSKRMLVHLGKKFLIGRSWSGVWDSTKNTEAAKFAEKYLELKDRAVEHLNQSFQGLLGNARATPQRTPAPAATPAPAGQAPTNTEVSQSMIRYWTNQGSIRMTPQRVNRIKRWQTEDIQHFIQNAGITRPARQILREIIRQRNNQGNPT